MKKLFTLFVVLVASVGMMFAESGTCGENLTWDLTNGVLTISGTGDMTNFNDEIPAPWHEHMESISSVVIGNNVTSIGNRAFYVCGNLASVTIPNSITRIGYLAFYGCTGLTSVTIPNGVSSIGDYAFCGCSSLSSITNHATSPQKIDANVFGGIVYDWGSDASWDVDKSIPLYVPYKSIDVYKTAEGWNEFTNIQTIPGTEVTEQIIVSLSVRFPASNRPREVEVIGSFDNWTGTALTWDSSTDYYEATFEATSSDFFKFRSAGSWRQELELYDEEYDSWSVIHDNLLVCGKLWEDVAGGKYIVLDFSNPNFCRWSITSGAGDNILASGTCGDHLTWVLDEDFVLTISGSGAMTNWKSTNDIPWFTYGHDIKAITIEEGVTSIGQSAFIEFIGITSVEIPNSVTSIERGAFNGCRNLTTVKIGYGVTSIGAYAFFYCSNLISVTMGNSVTQINYMAFMNCNSLINLEVPSSVTTIGDRAFYTVLNVIYHGTATGSPWGARCINGYVDDIFVYQDSTKTDLMACLPSVTGHVTIPTTVTSIGLNAFYGCQGISSITIPATVTSIKGEAFFGCTSLTEVTIPNSVNDIGRLVFRGCTGLTAVNVVSDNASYCSINGVLFDIDKTKLFIYPEGKRGAYTIPDGVISIEYSAFTDCINLTAITIPNSVARIEDYAFNECTGLTSVTMGDSVTSIGYATFYKCQGLTSIELPSGISNIGDWAFAECSGLKSITCKAITPPTCTNHSFKGDYSSLYASATLYVPAESVDVYKAADTWKEFTNILPIGGEVIVGSSCDNPIIVEDDVYESRYFMDPQGTKWYRVTNIPDIRNQGLGLTISVFNTSMKSSANIKLYYDCNQSAPFRQAELNPAWEWKINLSQEDYNQLFASGEPSLLIECTAESACLLEFDIKDLCYVAYGTCGDSLTWKLSCDSVLTISGTGEMTKFESYSAVPWYSKTGSITSVVIEEGVTSIGRDAFYSCSRLASVTIPNSVTRIGSNAFEYCISLTSIELPNSLTSIEYGVFWGCTNLTSILIPNSVTSIGWDAFYGCRSLTSIEIPNRVTSIGMNAFVGCSGITSLDIPNSVTNIEPGAFSSCTNLISVELPDSITTIEDSVFISCANLTSIEIPGGVTSIGLLAFYRCSGLTSITCQSVTPPTLGPEAFGYVDKSIPLYVPGAFIDAYKAAEGWKEFFNILPIPGTAIPEYTVIFLNWNGELLSEQSVAQNKAAVAPELPEREGFIFKGWTADIEHIVARTFAIALYDKVGVEVTYKAEDGEVLFSEHADLHFPNVPSIDGKTFSGWLTEMADNTNGIVLRATYTVDKPTEDDDVNVVPSSTTADVNFPYVTGAITYMLVISDMSDQVVCKIMFDANGKLLGIAFAPGRNGNKQQTPQVFGFTFKVEGLNPNTTYKYEFVAHDDEDEVIETLTGSFTTMAEAPSDVEYPEAENLSSVTKFIQDDQVLILRGDKAYTATGQEVK